MNLFDVVPGHVILGGIPPINSDTHLILSIDQALKNSGDNGEHVLWTTDIYEELSIQLGKTGIASVTPITIVEAFAEIVKQYETKHALGYKSSNNVSQFQMIDWKDYWNNCCQFSKSLIEIGHQPRDRVLIMGAGHPCWHISHFGTIFCNGVSGSIYSTNGELSTRFIIEQSEAILIVVDTLVNLNKILSSKQSGYCPTLRYIVLYMDDIPDTIQHTNILHWNDFLAIGRHVSDIQITERMNSQKPGMCCSLVYTSGTTGVPKGVMLSHDNCLWTTYSLLQGLESAGTSMTQKEFKLHTNNTNKIQLPQQQLSDSVSSTVKHIRNEQTTAFLCQSFIQKSYPLLSAMLSFPRTVTFTSNERVISYLPLSHIAPQIIDLYIPLLSGCCVYFAQPDALKGSLATTLKEVKPTFMFGVPRVYEKIEEAIKQAASNQNNGNIQRYISDWVKSIGYRGTTALLRGEEPPFGFSLIQYTIFKKIRKALGLDCCKALASGAAPLQSNTQNYFLSLGIPICDMYGMSECSGPQTANVAYPGWFKSQTAGVPIPGTEILIYKPSTHGVGEVCFRGRNVFMGYYKNKEETMKTIDDHGFLHSGDMGHIDTEGFLRITGRIKELIVTAGGENVAPVAIENVILDQMKFLSNCIVIGDRRKFLSVLIALRSVLDKDGKPTNILEPNLKILLKQSGSTATTIQDAAKCPIMHHIVQEGINKANELAISAAQKVVRFRIISEDFTQEGGELTPTLKLKRGAVQQKYAALIEDIYNDNLEEKNSNLNESFSQSVTDDKNKYKSSIGLSKL